MDADRGGWRAVLDDTETRLAPGGQGFEDARREAVAYLAERLAHLGDAPATRRAGLRLALLRILAARP